ncbi:prolyl oligopeptidase family serine peptidase [Candidatus Dependentiae bacterium]
MIKWSYVKLIILEVFMKKLVVLFILMTFAVKGMADELSLHTECFSPVVYAIPGQNGLGSDKSYVEEIMGDNCEIIPVSTPTNLPDLGQSFCERHLDDALKIGNKEGVIYATSQGTATALNYVASSNRANQIKALVLEAAMASGNSAIYHTVTGPLMDMKIVKNIPGSYYVLPYLANLVCPGYRPAGKQAIKSIDNIPNDLPIIIIHSEGDKQLPFEGACALYNRLRKNGNENVYLVRKEGAQHIRILNSDNDKSMVKRILKKHLLRSGEDCDNLSEFQPDPSRFGKEYQDLIAKERRHTHFERVLGLAGLVLFLKQMCGF